MSAIRTMNKVAPTLQNQQGDLVGISDELLQQLNAMKTTNHYREGQIIFYEGNQPFGLFYVHSGTVKIYKYNLEGKVYISKVVGPGELLGYGSFFTQTSYNETAEAMDDAVISFLDKAMVMNVLKQHPQLSLKFLNKCGKDLHDAEERASDIAYKSAQERIIDLMISLQQRYGVIQADGAVQINLKLSREDIASMIGSTLETAVRVLSRLKESQLIRTQARGSIVVINPKVLAAKAS